MYAGDEYHDDDTTSGLAEWAEVYALDYDDHLNDLDRDYWQD